MANKNEVRPVKEDVVNHPSHYAPNGVDSFMHMKDRWARWPSTASCRAT